MRNGDQVTLHFIDPLLGQPFELMPDLLVIDSRPMLSAAMRSLAESARLGTDPTGYLQSGNVHLWPQGLDRTGIFAAGPGKGPLMVSTAIEEGRGAALAVHRFFQDSPLEPLDREVVVDTGLCTLCLTCVRFCPHQAIGWTHRIFIHPLACRRCGICAGECPMDAIQIAGYSDAEVEQALLEISGRWEKTAAAEPRIIVFGCRRSAGVAWDEMTPGAKREAQGEKMEISTSWTWDQGSVAFIGLPCAGKLDPDFLLKALSRGADGVLVLACPEENCRSNHGNTYARDRLAEALDYLEEAGLDRRRLRFEHISSNRVYFLNEVLQDFIQKIKGWWSGRPRRLKIANGYMMDRLDIKKLDPDFKNRVARELGGEHIRKCYACGVCSARCPIEKIEPEYNPRKIIRMIILGLEQDLLQEELLWHCSNCYTCQESCPRKGEFHRSDFRFKKYGGSPGTGTPGYGGGPEPPRAAGTDVRSG